MLDGLDVQVSGREAQLRRVRLRRGMARRLAAIGRELREEQPRVSELANRPSAQPRLRETIPRSVSTKAQSGLRGKVTGSSGAEADISPLSLCTAPPPASRAASTLCSVASARSSRRRGTACPHEIAAENLTRRLRGWQWLCVRGACRAGCPRAAARLDPAPTQTPSERHTVNEGRVRRNSDGP